MHIRSWGLQTDFMFARFAGTVTDKGHYTVVQTPSNPTYHWGNYLVMDHSPRDGSLEEWQNLFNQEFTYYPAHHHYAFTWDTASEARGSYDEFSSAGYEFESNVMLTATQVRPPSRPNHELVIRPLSSAADWKAVVDLQILCAAEKFQTESFRHFKTTQMQNYRRMSEAGMGHWFGAFLNGQVVGDLGLFHENGIGRYQNVGTHPAFRGQGICGTLVHHAGAWGIEKIGLKILVMEADPDYHAAKIYESVGFVRGEIRYSLSRS